MKIEILGEEVLVARFSTFEDLTMGYKVDEEQLGRPVNLYALDVLLIGIALWLLDKAVDKAIDKSVDWVADSFDRNVEPQANDAAWHHEELIQELRSLKEAISQARTEAYELGNLKSFSPKLPQTARFPARLTITLDAGPDRDLSDAFSVLSRFIPLEITDRSDATIGKVPSPDE